MNYMKEFAQMLGLELDEEFLIDGCNDKYKITEDGFLYYDDENDWQPSMVIVDVLEGRAKIKKLPWKPKLGETYYTFIGGNIKDKNWVIGENKWCDGLFDFIWLKLGLTFKTREEAKAALPRVYKELTGKEI